MQILKLSTPHNSGLTELACIADELPSHNPDGRSKGFPVQVPEVSSVVKTQTREVRRYSNNGTLNYEWEYSYDLAEVMARRASKDLIKENGGKLLLNWHDAPHYSVFHFDKLPPTGGHVNLHKGVLRRAIREGSFKSTAYFSDAIGGLFRMFDRMGFKPFTPYGGVLRTDGANIFSTYFTYGRRLFSAHIPSYSRSSAQPFVICEYEASPVQNPAASFPLLLGSVGCPQGQSGVELGAFSGVTGKQYNQVPYVLRHILYQGTEHGSNSNAFDRQRKIHGVLYEDYLWPVRASRLSQAQITYDLLKQLADTQGIKFSNNGGTPDFKHSMDALYLTITLKCNTVSDQGKIINACKAVSGADMHVSVSAPITTWPHAYAGKRQVSVHCTMPDKVDMGAGMRVKFTDPALIASRMAEALFYVYESTSQE